MAGHIVDTLGRGHPLHLWVPHPPTQLILDLEDALVHLSESDLAVVHVLAPWPLAFLLLALFAGGVVSIGRARQRASGSLG